MTVNVLLLTKMTESKKCLQTHINLKITR